MSEHRTANDPAGPVPGAARGPIPATGELYACMPFFAAADGASDEGQLALQDRHLRRSGPHAPVICAYARGVYDGVHLAAALAGGPRPARRTAAGSRLGRADGLVFREVLPAHAS